MIIDSLKDIEWGIMFGKTDVIMTKLEAAQKLTREWNREEHEMSSYERTRT